MKIAFILGSLSRCRPSVDALTLQEQNIATNVERQLFPDSRVLSGQDNCFGKLSSPIYTNLSQNGRHTFYWLYRHGEQPHPIPPHRINYCANLYALRRLGVHAVFALNAFGSLDEDTPPGSHVVPDQLIDYSWGRRQTFFDAGQIPEDIFPAFHVDFTSPFSDRFRRAWLSLFDGTGINVRDGGVCAVTQGPRLESKAEIQRLRQDGCHFVNMTLCPEAALARELGMHYLCSAFISNWGAGMHNTTSIDVSQCERLARAGLGQVADLIEQIRQEHCSFDAEFD